MLFVCRCIQSGKTVAVMPEKIKQIINEKIGTNFICSDLVEEGGFEPPKLKAADLQSVPFGHSGTLPNKRA